MDHKKILIAEDDNDILEILSLYLESNGFQVYLAHNGQEALELFEKENISIALVDIMMPIINGYELIKTFRKKNNIPIIIVSAKNMGEDKILGLDIGADAYITKPFNPLEVVATVKAVLRRTYQYEKNNNIVIGELEFNEREFILRKNGEIVNLTSTELKILSKMMKEPGKIFSKEQLYESISDEYFETDANTMMVHISNIRNKIRSNQYANNYIKTIRGVGYKIEEN